MTLPAWYNLVKLSPALRTAIWASAGLVWLTLLVGWQLASQAGERVDRYGALAAQSIATLTRSPLLKQDRIELGLIINQMRSLPGVTGITIVGVDDQVLSNAGQPGNGREYSHAIELDDAVIGYARVTVAPGAVLPAPVWPWIIGAVLAIAMPWLVQWTALLAMRVQAQRSARHAHARAAPAQAATTDDAPMRTAQPATDLYVVVANLLNQFGLSPEERQQALATARAVATAVAEPHDGQIETLGDTGLALWFNDDGDPDYPPRLLRSALLLTRLLPSMENTGAFRVAMHRRAASDLHLTASAVRTDAALMTAAAGASQVILSSACEAAMAPDQLQLASTIVHPLGRDFSTAEPRCHRIETLTPAQEQHLTRQLGELSDQFGATDSESTF